MSTSRTAVVTGATSGIGEAVCARFVEAGHRVVASGRRQAALEDLASRLGVVPVVADVTDDDFASVAFAAARRLGPPSIVVVSAGRGLPGTLLGSDPTQWAELLEVNLTASMHLMRHAAQQLLLDAQTAPGTRRDIVVVGSTAGRDVSGANPVYGATKFALHSLVEALRREVCSSTIRVTLVEPGFVRTGFQEAASYDMDWFDDLETTYGPFLEADDVARAITFAVDQPPAVHLDTIRIRPTRQVP